MFLLNRVANSIIRYFKVGMVVECVDDRKSPDRSLISGKRYIIAGIENCTNYVYLQGSPCAFLPQRFKIIK